MSDQVLELKNKGNQAFQNKDYDIAIDYFTQAIELDPTNHVLFSNRSASYAQLSQFQKALEDADKCIELKKDFVKGYSRRGAALHGLNRLDDAQAAYSEGLKLDPTNAACQEGLNAVQNDLDSQKNVDPASSLKNMFKGAMDTVRSHPTLKQYANDPEFVKKVEMLEQDPTANLQVALTDPRMQTLLAALLHLPDDALNRPPPNMDSYPGAPNDFSNPTMPPSNSPYTSTSSSSSSSSSSSASATTKAAPKVPEVDPNSPKGKALALKNTGNTLYKKKEFEEAIRYYLRAFEEFPEEPTFLLNLSAAYMELGNRCEKDIEQLKKESEEGKSIADTTVPLEDARVKISQVLYEERKAAAEQKKAAKAAAKKAKEEKKEESFVTKDVVDGDIVADDDDEEEKKADEEVAADNEEDNAASEEEKEEEIEAPLPAENVDELRKLSFEEIIKRKQEEQNAHYNAAMSECEKALEVAQKYHSSYQTTGKIYMRMSNIETKRVNYDKALDLLHKSMMEHRTDEAVKKESELKKLIAKKAELDYLDPEKGEEARKAGNDEFMKGNFPEAIKLYTESIKRNPKDARVFSNRAACYSKLMQWSSAMDDCDKAIALDANFIKPYIRKANIQVFLKQYPQAMKSFEAALNIDPNNGDAQNGYRDLMFRIQQSQQGDTADEQQIAEAMKDPEIRAIMQDPVMQNVLQDMQQNPVHAQQHLQNPKIAQGIAKLMAAGIIKTR